MFTNRVHSTGKSCEYLLSRKNNSFTALLLRYTFYTFWERQWYVKNSEELESTILFHDATIYEQFWSNHFSRQLFSFLFVDFSFAKQRASFHWQGTLGNLTDPQKLSRTLSAGNPQVFAGIQYVHAKWSLLCCPNRVQQDCVTGLYRKRIPSLLPVCPFCQQKHGQTFESFESGAIWSHVVGWKSFSMDDQEQNRTAPNRFSCHLFDCDPRISSWGNMFVKWPVSQ